MDDFSIPGIPNAFGLWPSPYNYPEPNKRPLSSIVPTIIEDASGRFVLSVGGAGGSRIFGAVFQTILNALDGGLDISAAIEHGRVHDQLFPPIVDVDNVLGIDVARALKAKGHNVSVTDVNAVKAVVNGVMQIGDTIYGEEPTYSQICNTMLTHSSS
jgi:gamma-glutamyltranspeptidase / glutathione hydrolase / leukotriene-C4 hydrolase